MSISLNGQAYKNIFRFCGMQYKCNTGIERIPAAAGIREMRLAIINELFVNRNEADKDGLSAISIDGMAIQAV